jgi:hypothetical protein
MGFNLSHFVKRNRNVAISRYGNLLDEKRCVKGTDIWFDGYWRMHRGKLKIKKES